MPPAGVRVRLESAADVAAVRAVHGAAFPTDAESRLVDALRANGKALAAVVAESAGKVVGHVLFSSVTLAGAPPGAGLAPLAVLPAHQRRGIGSALVREGLALCAARGIAFVVVLGDPDYYGRFGFRRASARGLGNEYGADDAFRVLELDPGCLDGHVGVVHYAPEFARFGA